MELLKLIALDDEDLRIISAHLQDAVLRVGDMAFRPNERQFLVILNRFNWLSVGDKSNSDTGFERRMAALRFERVQNAQFQNIDLRRDTLAVELLAMDFESTDPPSGFITLFFSGGSAVRLEVECIEAEIRDLGPIWSTQYKPEHPDDDATVKATG